MEENNVYTRFSQFIKFVAPDSYNDYPEAVKENAARGIRLNDEVNNKCATQVGKVRAQQLANGESISVETIKRMYLIYHVLKNIINQMMIKLVVP